MSHGGMRKLYEVWVSGSASDVFPGHRHARSRAARPLHRQSGVTLAATPEVSTVQPFTESLVTALETTSEQNCGAQVRQTVFQKVLSHHVVFTLLGCILALHTMF